MSWALREDALRHGFARTLGVPGREITADLMLGGHSNGPDAHLGRIWRTIFAEEAPRHQKGCANDGTGPSTRPADPCTGQGVGNHRAIVLYALDLDGTRAQLAHGRNSLPAKVWNRILAGRSNPERKGSRHMARLPPNHQEGFRSR